MTNLSFRLLIGRCVKQFRGKLKVAYQDLCVHCPLMVTALSHTQLTCRNLRKKTLPGVQKTATQTRKMLLEIIRDQHP